MPVRAAQLKTEEQLDRDLLPILKRVSVEEYEYLVYDHDIDSGRMKDEFIAGLLEEPFLQYPLVKNLDLDAYDDSIKELEDGTTQLSGAARLAYEHKLEELRNTAKLLKSAQNGRDYAFFEASKGIYGTPKKEIFDVVMQSILGQCAAATARISHPFLTHAVERLESMNSDSTILNEDEAALIFERAPNRNPRGLTAQEIKFLVEDSFDHYSITEWKAVIDEPGKRVTFNTNQGEKIIYIPSDEDLKRRKTGMSRVQACALIAHEVGTHVVRRERGEASRLGLLGRGLAGYLRGEEGIATYMQQKIEGRHGVFGEIGYFVVSVALGLDGEPRTFRETYEVVFAYYVLQGFIKSLREGTPPDPDHILEDAKRFAWARCIRVYRGTTGLTAGAAFTRDIVYAEGNIAIWELVANDPTIEETFFVGKHNPANPAHISILEELEIL